MTNKTKIELEAEIKNLKQQLEDKNKEEKFDAYATELYTMYTAYIKAGFTEEQAWVITETIVNNGTTSKNSIF